MSSTDIRGAIQSTNDRFLAALARGDAADAAAVYTEDGQALPPNGEIATGRAAIQAIWQGAIEMGVKAATLTSIELKHSGAAAYEVGKYTLLGERGERLDTGKYIVIWQQEDGQWKWHRDIWNSSMPAAG